VAFLAAAAAAASLLLLLLLLLVLLLAVATAMERREGTQPRTQSEKVCTRDTQKKTSHA